MNEATRNAQKASDENESAVSSKRQHMLTVCITEAAFLNIENRFVKTKDSTMPAKPGSSITPLQV